MITTPEPQPSPPSLTVGLFTGLADRLKVLVSALAVAEATGRQLSVKWARTVHCGAGFDDLFENDWPVVDSTEEEVRALPLLDMGDDRHHSDLLRSAKASLAYRADGWLIDPARYPEHEPLQKRCGTLIDSLEPKPQIEARVESFRNERFRERMVGVHLRRADYLSFDARAATGTNAALRAVDGYLARWRDAGVLLCTDDGGIDTFTGKPSKEQGVRHDFRKRYGDRVVSPEPRSMDRREVLAVQDALVDLLLLRATDAVVGTQGSSFSELAAFGRGVPFVDTHSSNPLIHLRPIWLWLNGDMSTRVARRYYGRLVRQKWF